jgi:hypothetical protein
MPYAEIEDVLALRPHLAITQTSAPSVYDVQRVLTLFLTLIDGKVEFLDHFLCYGREPIRYGQPSETSHACGRLPNWKRRWLLLQRKRHLERVDYGSQVKAARVGRGRGSGIADLPTRP